MKKGFEEWFFSTSSSVISGLIILVASVVLARPAYDRLLNAVQQNNQSAVTVSSSPNSSITVNQALQAVNEITNPQTIQSLPDSYRLPLQNLRKASEDAAVVLGNTKALDKPVSEFKNIAGMDTVYVKSGLSAGWDG